jgi:hypothetical protein
MTTSHVVAEGSRGTVTDVIRKWSLSCFSVAAVGFFLVIAVGVLAPSTQSPATTNLDPFYPKSKLLRMANGVTPDGAVFSENIYQGPDGNKVYFRIVHYPSPERAQGEFDSRIKAATRILDRTEAKRGIESAISVHCGERNRASGK